MLPQKMKLNHAAKLLGVHPRTVLRAVEGRENVYWAEGFDPDIDPRDVCKAFKMSEARFEQVLLGRDELFKVQGASSLLGCLDRTFRARRYKPTLRKGNIVRYSRVELVEEHLRRFSA